MSGRTRPSPLEDAAPGPAAATLRPAHTDAPAPTPRSRQQNADGSMLIVAPLPYVRVDGRLLVESQAHNGLRQWLRHFPRVTMAAPCIDATPSAVPFPCRPFDDLDGFTPAVLPDGYPLPRFARNRPRAVRLLSELIDAHEFLQFGVGLCTCGDWAALAAKLARRRRRPFAVHTDRVEHRVALAEARRRSPLRRLRALGLAAAARRQTARTVRSADLGLFHGADCFNEYAPLCASPALIHDIHLGRDQRLPDRDLDRKADRVRRGDPLRIVYVGRAAPMKGPLQWLDTLAAAARAGVPFQAAWLGDGPLLDEMKSAVASLELGDRVRLAGFVSDRAAVVEALRDADLLLFCHLTPESPRNLIEALMSATPIVGFHSAYAEDLLARHGGGRLVPCGDTHALAQALADLHRDRDALAARTRQAWTASAEFTDDAVFAHRAELIKSHLRPTTP